MIHVVDADLSSSTRIRQSAVGSAIESWLAERDLTGVDVVRAELALSLAAELDDPDAPHYAKARLSSELRTLIAEIEGIVQVDSYRTDVRRLLAGVMPPPSYSLP